MARVVPLAFAELFPALRPIVVDAPLVHVMTTVPAASRGVVSFVTMGSYGPKPMHVELMVQLLETLAVTVKFEVAGDAAKAEPAPISARNDAASPPRRLRYLALVFTSVPSVFLEIPGRFRASALRKCWRG